MFYTGCSFENFTYQLYELYRVYPNSENRGGNYSLGEHKENYFESGGRSLKPKILYQQPNLVIPLMKVYKKSNILARYSLKLSLPFGDVVNKTRSLDI